MIAILAVVAAIPMLGSAETHKVKVTVSYSGRWSGTVNAGGNISTWSGQGSNSMVIAVPDGSDHSYVSAYATKSDMGSGELKVSITTVDGLILAQGSSSSNFVQVQANWQG